MLETQPLRSLSGYGLARSTALTLVLSSFVATAQEPEPEPEPEPEFENVIVAKDVMVPMRDGVRLATDIYRPGRGLEPAAGRFPTLLSRTPYGKNASAEAATFLARRGYVVVMQDVRGRFDSEGTFYIYLSEGRDGYDTVEWAAQQAWSTGNVGTFGGSYLAATQHALAVESPPHLRAMFVQVSTSSYWEDGAGAGGAFALLHNLVYALNLAGTSKEARDDPAMEEALRRAVQSEDLKAWLLAYPFRPNASPVGLNPAYQRWFQDWVDHASLDEYWTQNGYNFELHYERYPDVPIYHIGGWYDIFLRGTLRNHAGLARLHASPTHLMIGPWEHGVGPRATGDVDFGESAEVDMQLERLLWFDRVLKGKPLTETETARAPLRLFLMGGGDGSRSEDGRLNHGGEWVSLDTWPPEEATPRPFYLHADGTLSERRPLNGAAPSAFAFDPDDPVPTIGGKINSGDALVPSGPYNQRCIEGRIFGCHDNLPLSARRDVLVFQTPPLEEELVIMGPLTVTLWVASSAKDTDFTAKLIDVYPPSEDYPQGYDLLISDRILRARFRNRLDKEELLEPGTIYEITIDLLGVANRFQKGHRVRLDVSSSNFPFFDVNPNTGEPPGHYSHRVTAVNSVYHDAEHASRLVLPIVTTTQAKTEP